MKLKAGIARAKITPSVRVELGGYGARFGSSEGIHDDLYTKVLILDNGENRIVLITNDLLGFDYEFVARLRGLIHRELGIEEENVMIAASHNHSSPVTSFGLQSTGAVDQDYLRILQKRIVGAVCMASNNMREATIGAGSGEVRGVSYNRSGYSKDIDPELGVVLLNDAEGDPIVFLINYACHAVVLGPGNLLISADYPGVVQRFVEKARNGMAMFTQGGCGDIDPLINLRAWGKGSFKDMEEMGTVLGAEAIKIGEHIETVSAVRLKAKSKTIELPTERLPSLEEAKEEVREYEKKLKKLEEKDNFVERKIARMNLQWARNLVNMVKKDVRNAELAAEIQLFLIDEIILVGISAEVFAGVGLAIKKESGLRNTFVVGCANGCVGYIPSEEAFKQGGYETEEVFKWYGNFSPFVPDVGKIVKRNVLNLIETLR